jgi:DNA-binding NtrC family response regulator
MTAPIRTLLVEDEVNMVRTLSKILERKGHAVDSAANGAEALQRLEQSSYDLVVTDLNMPVMDGMQLLRAMNERGWSPATIVLTGHGTIQSAVEAMKLGAGDYVIKPCHPDELLLAVSRLLEVRELRREVRQLRQQLRDTTRYGEIAGKSPAMQEIYAVIDAVSQNKSNVLISGENGTGKELVARTIHNKGAFAARPFLAINCDRRRCSRANCSDTAKGRSPARSMTMRVCSRRPVAVRCSSTRSPTSRCLCR